jgi:hypothetical protein
LAPLAEGGAAYRRRYPQPNGLPASYSGAPVGFPGAVGERAPFPDGLLRPPREVVGTVPDKPGRPGFLGQASIEKERKKPVWGSATLAFTYCIGQPSVVLIHRSEKCQRNPPKLSPRSPSQRRSRPRHYTAVCYCRYSSLLSFRRPQCFSFDESYSGIGFGPFSARIIPM